MERKSIPCRINRNVLFLSSHWILKMKFLTFLLFAALTQTWATGYSQKVTLKRENITLESALKEVERNTKYLFLYDRADLPADHRVSINVKNESIDVVLRALLNGLPLSYKIFNKNIVIRNEPKLSVKQAEILIPNRFPAPEMAVKIIVTGKVLDDRGEGLPGVNVLLKGTQKGATTDVNGDFSLEIPDTKAVLVFSFVGYVSQEVTVGKSTSLEVRMQVDKKNLQEVVVIGYGTQTKANLTGAVAIVDKKQLENRPSANVSSLLQGTIPNMEVKFASGAPGTAGTFNIRGINSISSSATPLIMIDGFEGTIDRVNPDDIESITVLKDASASAVYGARASYGVILITTKSGNKNKVSVNYSAKTSFSASTTSTDFETRGYYSAKINDLFFKSYAGSNYTKYTEEDYNQLWARVNDKTENPARPWIVTDNRDGRPTYVYYANTDWFNYLYDLKRPMQDHNISVSGGSDNIRYYFSGNVYTQDGIFKSSTDVFKRYNLRSKVDFKINNWMDINTNFAYFNSDYKYPGVQGINNNFTGTTFHALASFVPQNPDGTSPYNTSLSNYNIMDGLHIALTDGKHLNDENVSEISPTIETVLRPFKGFTFRANYRYSQINKPSYTRSGNLSYSKYPGEVLNLTSGPGNNVLTERSEGHDYQGVNLYMTYDVKLRQNHDVKLMAGYNYETTKSKYLTASREGLLSDQLSDLDIATGTMSVRGGQYRYQLLGTFYRANYAYKDKYLFEAAGRYDGTSRFAKGSRFGFFPSFSAGWRIDEEEFFKSMNQNILTNAKIRLSYGSLGNQQVGYYDYIQTITMGGNLSYSFGNALAPYAYESAPNSPSLTWETVNTTDLGLDLSFLNSRLTLTGDIYHRATLNMLTAGLTLPAYYGASFPKENSSDLLTKGWELSMAWRDQFNVAGKALKYNIGVGVGDNITKVTRFNNPTKNLSNFYEGMTLGDIWGYNIGGYFKTNEEAANYPVNQTFVNSIINVSAIDKGLHAGDMKFLDLDGDNKISIGENTLAKPGDRTIIGNSLPRYNFNFNLRLNWNNIELSAFVQGIGRQHWYPDYDAVAFWGPYSRPYTTFLPTDFESKVWSEDNPDAYFPKPRGYVALNANRELGVVNDKYLQNLMYARLKNLMLGYTIPGKLTKQIGLERVHLYLSGENLLTFTTLDTKYIDPEQASAQNTYGVSRSTARTYPWAKTFMFGLNISL